MVFLNAQNIYDDHPALEILHVLETATYYVDENFSDHILSRCVIQVILRWADMLNCRLKVGVALCTLFYFLKQLPRGSLSLFPTAT